MGLRSKFVAFPGCLGTAVSTAEKIGDGLAACRKSSSYAHPHLLQSGASPCAVRHLPVIFVWSQCSLQIGVYRGPKAHRADIKLPVQAQRWLLHPTPPCGSDSPSTQNLYSEEGLRLHNRQGLPTDRNSTPMSPPMSR